MKTKLLKAVGFSGRRERRESAGAYRRVCEDRERLLQHRRKCKGEEYVKKWQAQASPNIALIKYMGKSNSKKNIPSNASLSYTLDYLYTKVELELTSQKKDSWQGLDDSAVSYIPNLNPLAQQRFLNHLNFLKKHFKFKGNFIVRSASNFPAACGIASSASSFAALTLCAAQAMSELSQQKMPSLQQLAAFSRHGSGSSCRSLFSPWAEWRNEKVMAVKLPYQHLLHMVIVVNDQAKKVSSSEAHRRVVKSLLFKNRTERAEQRLQLLKKTFKNKKWLEAYQIVWQEFWDMHALFETAQPPFGYFTPEVMQVLAEVHQIWEKNADGPLITMDAGPSIHLLFRPEQKQLFSSLQRKFSRSFKVLGR